MDKELDKMEFKLNGLSALYRVETRQAVQSPLYLNTLEAFQKWDRFHRLMHKNQAATDHSCSKLPWHILPINAYLEQ